MLLSPFVLWPARLCCVGIDFHLVFFFFILCSWDRPQHLLQSTFWILGESSYSHAIANLSSVSVILSSAANLWTSSLCTLEAVSSQYREMSWIMLPDSTFYRGQLTTWHNFLDACINQTKLMWQTLRLRAFEPRSTRSSLCTLHLDVLVLVLFTSQ